MRKLDVSELRQERELLKRINELFAYGAPASTPPLDSYLRKWRKRQ